ncbi:hypothetical protein HBI56_157320 [Parastagonospora nodorum]|uniref:Uncharacterized protein n=2 Tax=Phaeosphaeria nodorum (strain SN15 / ATCC MYA-4574 / FGSC 10173) TaxID=321614 RepID=A0A7U2ESX7_PHANO|nr:hypothetical protein SNOG_02352 [Parastagonospora nodorum SN15]KAH3907361.1 hypothetical protein HBH56_188060 [Parastagonospora nodorum]EAT90564.1 hypothetical protein SNOG_02352 [Parastagonospora nodorum SN15]KAH3925002.1 hypothetical protein HBH54_183870 [Parastagonospora nodorum]KAH3954429.1 hypothetical protein HBH53_023220 [Parastagonospora nodorum]KAH3963839.1 hypothetical protein HBH51_163050 [Parastagonospora nodorum]
MQLFGAFSLILPWASVPVGASVDVELQILDRTGHRRVVRKPKLPRFTLPFSQVSFRSFRLLGAPLMESQTPRPVALARDWSPSYADVYWYRRSGSMIRQPYDHCGNDQIIFAGY